MYGNLHQHHERCLKQTKTYVTEALRTL